MAKDNTFGVTIPSYLMPKFNKVMESLNLGRQETVLHLISEHTPVTPTIREEPVVVIKGGQPLDWKATEPYYFGQSNYGFHCRYHGTKHTAGTDMLYAGPEDESGNRRKICDEAAEELGLKY